MVQRNGFLLFAKPPVPGMVKTRLTTSREGIFTEVQAAALFRRMMLDVFECSMQALDLLEEQNRREREADPTVPEQAYDVFVSTTPESNLDLMKDVFELAGEWPRPINFIVDKGKIFDDHFDNAFNQVFESGCETCVSIGGDLPIMPRTHIVDAFSWLHRLQQRYPGGGVVLAPCQAAGVSLIGYTASSGMDHQGVYYNLSGRPAMQAYMDKSREAGLHIAMLDTVPDVDTMEDLSHVVSYIDMLEFVQDDQDLFLPSRTLEFIRRLGLKVVTEPNRNFDNRDQIDV